MTLQEDVGSQNTKMSKFQLLTIKTIEVVFALSTRTGSSSVNRNTDGYSSICTQIS